MTNIIVALTILLIIGTAISKILIEKRKGTKCVGCPLSGSCSSNKSINNKMLTQKIKIKE